METKIKLGANISALRRARGMTQEQLAAALGVSAPAVSKWETDSSYPDITLLCPLARALGTDVDGLIGFEADLSEEELGKEINSIAKMGQEGDWQAAEERICALLRQYPSSAELKYYAVMVYSVLEMSLFMQEKSSDIAAADDGDNGGEGSDSGDGRDGGEGSCITGKMDCADRRENAGREYFEKKKGEWKAKKRELLRAVCGSRGSSCWQNAVCDLAMMQVMDGDLEGAEAGLRSLPERQADPTMAWMRLHLARGDREKARAAVQRRLYVLVGQVQQCLLMLMDEAMEPEAAQALAIGEVYCQMEDLFGYGGGMGAGVLAEVYQRMGDGERELEAMMKAAEALCSPATRPRRELFDTLVDGAGEDGQEMKRRAADQQEMKRQGVDRWEARWNETAWTMRQMLRAELVQKKYADRFQGNEAFQALVKKLEG